MAIGVATDSRDCHAASRPAKGEGSSFTVNVRLDDELADRLEQCDDRESVHKSDVVRKALRAYLA